MTILQSMFVIADIDDGSGASEIHLFVDGGDL
jgi:hypothetical protein